MSFLGNDNLRREFQSLHSDRQERQSRIGDTRNVSSIRSPISPHVFPPHSLPRVGNRWLDRYAFLRHPSYAGFYYWAVGTQLVLSNPLSTILYGLAAWTFFRHRIAFEEKTLKQLFPDGVYESYVARTYIGIPFVHLALHCDRK